MSHTPAQIRYDAAKKLGVLGDGQTLQSELAADILQAYNEVYAELEARDLVSWGASDSAPDRFSWIMSTMVARHYALQSSIPSERMQWIEAQYQEAWRRLRALQYRDANPPTEMADY